MRRAVPCRHSLGVSERGRPRPSVHARAPSVPSPGGRRRRHGQARSLRARSAPGLQKPGPIFRGVARSWAREVEGCHGGAGGLKRTPGRLRFRTIGTVGRSGLGPGKRRTAGRPAAPRSGVRGRGDGPLATAGHRRPGWTGPPAPRPPGGILPALAGHARTGHPRRVYRCPAPPAASRAGPVNLKRPRRPSSARGQGRGRPALRG